MNTTMNLMKNSRFKVFLFLFFIGLFNFACSGSSSSSSGAAAGGNSVGYCNGKAASQSGFCQTISTQGNLSVFQSSCTDIYGGTWATTDNCPTPTINRLGKCVYNATVSGVNSIQTNYFFSDVTGLYKTWSDSKLFCSSLNGANGTATWSTIYEGTYKGACSNSGGKVPLTTGTDVYYQFTVTLASDVASTSMKFYLNTTCTGTEILNIASTNTFEIAGDASISGLSGTNPAQKVDIKWPSPLTATTATALGDANGKIFFDGIFCAGGNKTLTASTSLDLAGNNCTNYGPVVAGDTEYTVLHLNSTNNALSFGSAYTGRVFGSTDVNLRPITLSSDALTKQ